MRSFRQAASLRALILCIGVSCGLLAAPASLGANQITLTDLWIVDNQLTVRGKELLTILKQSEAFGLDSRIFGLAQNDFQIPADKEAFKQQLDADFSTFVRALSQGLSTPGKDAEWSIPQQPVSLAELKQKVQSGTSFSQIARQLLPESTQYHQMLEAVQRLKAIKTQGGWPSAFTSEATLRAGQRDPEVVSLRNRLRLEGDHTALMQADPWFFSAALRDALQQYQTRNGLLASGDLNQQTRRSLQIPIEKRISQLEVNLERWRWLPRQLGDRHLLVNTAGGYANLFEGGQSTLRIRTIAGRPYRATPSLSSTIKRVVLNPSWGVPHRIATNDLLPMQQRNKAFFKQKGIRVYSTKGEIDPSSVDWDSLNARHFPYQLRQDPGPTNSMGKVKFVFENNFDVYLHDTPNKVLFELPNRRFSSGCVRVDNALQLAKSIVTQPSRAATVLDQFSQQQGTVTQTVELQDPLPIYLVYLTAWVDDNGLVHFASDAYGRDSLAAEQMALNTHVLALNE